ncbi:MAG: hypothetical protein M0016_03645 [Deltaproteobacteria bacterium]|jgi:hypothetical protein|nr:DUF4912 domain-containing protein [Deltaproteobacteria bacterium]MCL5880774.1 DUF4912 domain-containing protein [Deltaproteobacteria bacterium]MDA8304240.1 hypothetical protein [Deltaproteobacteria bacterium]
MENSLKVTLIFNQDLLNKAKIKKTIYAKISDEKKEQGLIEKLKAKALDENIRFQKRKLPQSFEPVFKGYVLFSGETKLSDEILKSFANIFFDRLEENFGINVINYSLIEAKKGAIKENYKLKLLDFEIFNYNFNEHRAIKSELTKAGRIKEANELAETIFAKPKLKPKLKKIVNKKAVRGKAIKENAPVEAFGVYEAPEEQAAGRVEVSEEVIKVDTREQVSLISLNWSLLSPSESLPVLESGEPAEIRQNSWVRIYFQKPGVRQVVWRLRDKPKTNSARPILRVYVDDKMLWYELLDNQFGSRYIIFPDDYELAKTWVEIGYILEKGEFIFIARSPIWPPACLFKRPPKINSKKRIPKGVALIGATEGIPGGRHLPVNLSGGSGAGFLSPGQENK